ncbi:MAG: TolC family protein [Bacteroidales bacterium]|jgi:outer membrane protein|nr:TolC family protein [Bacteroidales bacterium]
MYKNIVTVISFLLIISGSFAQEQSWSLEDCINYAMENNLMIKQTVLNTEYNKNILDQSKLSRYPSLNANSNYTYSFGRALDQTTYEFTDNQKINSISLGVNSGVTLFNGFQKKNTIAKNQISLMSSYEDVKKIKNDISLNIAAAYLQILFNNELFQVAKNQMEITNQQVERTQKMVEAGKLARGSALEIQAQFASEELNVVNTENQLLLSYLNLQQMLDMQYDPEFEIIIPNIPLPGDSLILMNVSDVYAIAEGILPQIKGSEYNLEAAKKDLDIAKGRKYPSLTMSANYNSGYSDIREKIISTSELGIPLYGKYPFFEQMNDNLSAGIGLGLNIPIFNGGQVNSGISNARIAIENSQLELQSKQNDLYSDIQKAYADAVASLKQFSATEKALVSMEESFKYTEKKFEVGLVNTVDYNTSKNQLTMTQSDLLKAKYDFIFKTKILNFYKGEAITL